MKAIEGLVRNRVEKQEGKEADEYCKLKMKKKVVAELRKSKGNYCIKEKYEEIREKREIGRMMRVFGLWKKEYLKINYLKQTELSYQAYRCEKLAKSAVFSLKSNVESKQTTRLNTDRAYDYNYERLILKSIQALA